MGLASKVFKTALSCQPTQPRASQLTQSTDEHQPCKASYYLPVPGVTKHQVLLLLHCLDTPNRDAWAQSLRPEDLFQLARVVDKYAWTSVLQLMDATLITLSALDDAGKTSQESFLSPANALAHLDLARDLHLSEYEVHVALYLGLHAQDNDLSQLDVTTARIVQGANMHHAMQLKRMLHLEK